MIHTMFPSPQIFQDAYIKNGSAWEELKTTSRRSYGLPDGVLMHAITGNTITDNAVQTVWTCITTLKSSKGANIDIYNIPSFMTSNIGKLSDFLAKVIKETPKFIKLKAALQGTSKFLGVVSFIYDVPSYMDFILDAVTASLFNNKGNDLIVSVNSATYNQKIANTVFINNVSEILNNDKNDRYAHWSICQQNDVGNKIASLLSKLIILMSLKNLNL